MAEQCIVEQMVADADIDVREEQERQKDIEHDQYGGEDAHETGHVFDVHGSVRANVEIGEHKPEQDNASEKQYCRDDEGCVISAEAGGRVEPLPAEGKVVENVFVPAAQGGGHGQTQGQGIEQAPPIENLDGLPYSAMEIKMDSSPAGVGGFEAQRCAKCPGKPDENQREGEQDVHFVDLREDVQADDDNNRQNAALEDGHWASVVFER